MELDPYHKNDQDKWEIISYEVVSLVELQDINLTFAIEQLYDGIIFEE